MNLSTLEYKQDITIDDAMKSDFDVLNAVKEYRLQSLNKVAIDIIIDRLNLEPFYEFLILFNKSNKFPYHNYYHSSCVFLNCYEGAWISDLQDFDEVRGLCTAALFHDFNHSGGILTDEENIKEALNGLKLAQHYAASKHLGLSTRSLEVAEAAIKITQFPFIKEPLTLTDRIIRDADMMQLYDEDESKLLKQYLGLKAEIELFKQITFTIDEFASGCRDFQNSIDWHTEWALKKAEVRNFYLIKINLEKLIRDSE